MKLRFTRGSIALTTLILASAVILTTGMVFIVTSADHYNSLKNTESVQEAEPVISSCFEEGMRKLKLNKNFTGSSSVTLGSNTCTVTVAGNSNTRTIVVNATLPRNAYTRTYTIDVSTNNFIVQ